MLLTAIGHSESLTLEAESIGIKGAQVMAYETDSGTTRYYLEKGDSKLFLSESESKARIKIRHLGLTSLCPRWCECCSEEEVVSRAGGRAEYLLRRVLKGGGYVDFELYDEIVQFLGEEYG